MAIIPGVIAHIRHYKAAREELQNEAKRRERSAPLDFGAAFDIDDANLIGETMRGFGVTLPDVPKMPEMRKRGSMMDQINPQTYQKKQQ